MIASTRLLRNTSWNLLAQAGPLLIAVITIPPLSRALGTDRFGVVNLFWILAGYFSLFDLGLGRATTQFVAKGFDALGEERGSALLWTSQTMMLALGALGGMAMAALTPWLVQRVLHVPSELRRETAHSFYVLAVAIPAVSLTTGLRGILEAKMHFGETSALRALLGVCTFVGPLAATLWSPSLISVAAVLVITRWSVCFAYIPLCIRAIPGLARPRFAGGSSVLELLRFGSWITVSNVVSPLMVNADRFVIGAVFSVSAIAFYATPFEMVTKINLLTGAFVSVLFPLFASGVRQRPEATVALLARGMRWTLLAIYPIVGVVALFAAPLLRLWLGTEFALRGSLVLQILCVGVYLNSIAYLPSAFVQAVGRPDLTAKLHLLEVPVYMPVLWFAAVRFGPSGVAAAWSLRVLADLILLSLAIRRVTPVRMRWGQFSLCAALTTAALLSAIPSVFGGWPTWLLHAAAYGIVVALFLREERGLFRLSDSETICVPGELGRV